MAVHQLKILTENFQAVASGKKAWELRKNDRNYQLGDNLVLNDFDGENYSGKKITAYVTYMFIGGKYGLAEDHCILSLRIIDVIIKKQTDE